MWDGTGYTSVFRYRPDEHCTELLDSLWVLRGECLMKVADKLEGLGRHCLDVGRPAKVPCQEDTKKCCVFTLHEGRAVDLIGA